MHLSLASKPHPARVCAAGAGWAVLVGYMRVSTAEQNLALQRDALLAAGIAPERIYDDTCSGAVTNRPGLARALEVVRDGHALAVWKLDRIGRSLGHVVQLVAGRNNIATDVAEQLGISVSTLYAYVDGEGQAKPRARKLLGAAGR